jgi:sulfatase maturation enzyme AslB (radical SAM superfamily)
MPGVRINIMKFKHPHDVRVNEPNTQAPFPAQACGRNSVVDQDFQRDRCARHFVRRKPGFGATPGAKLSDKGVTAAELRPAL